MKQHSYQRKRAGAIGQYGLGIGPDLGLYLPVTYLRHFASDLMSLGYADVSRSSRPGFGLWRNCGLGRPEAAGCPGLWRNGLRARSARTRGSAARRTTRRRAVWIGVLASLVLTLAGTTLAHAQAVSSNTPTPLPTTTLLSVSGASKNDTALDSAIHAALERLGIVNVTLRPGLDLRAVQLAIDCVGETTRCLRAVTSQSGVQLLLAPSLERHDQGLSLTLLYFDSRRGGELRRISRHKDGTEGGPELLDAIPDMLRELFRLSAPVPALAAASAPEPAPQSTVTTDNTPSDSEPAAGPAHYARPLPVGPLVLGGAGVLVLGGGVVAGLMMQSTQRDYERLPVTTQAEANAAINKRSDARTQALVANILCGVGASALAAAGIWLAIALSDPRDEQQTALVPMLAPGQMGLSLVHRGGSL
jgi:hypothetical protein